MPVVPSSGKLRIVFFKLYTFTDEKYFLISRINAVSNGQVRGDSYSDGCMGQIGVYNTF